MIPEIILDKINEQYPIAEKGSFISDFQNIAQVKLREAAIWGYELDKWISVKDGLPESGKRVLILWENSNKKQRTSLGFYAAKFSVVDDCEDNRDGYSEYNEEKDEYYYPEGWTECPSEVEYTAELSDVTHWMEIPKRPII